MLAETAVNFITLGKAGVHSAIPASRQARIGSAVRVFVMLRDGFKSLAISAGGQLAQRPAARRMVFNALRLRRPDMMEVRDIDAMRFLASVFSELSESKAQILQDLWVLFELGRKRGGYFVEFGATNGLTNSNTWLLEHGYGWTGILAEPNPVWHAALKTNRRCAIDTRCVYGVSGETLNFLSPDDPELSGLSLSSGHDHYAERRAAGEAFDVTTISLNHLLAAHGAPREIDYISVDTEGSEYPILETFDFARYDVSLFSIEHNFSVNQAKIDALMARNGYRRRFPEFSQWDGWYVRDRS
jgi:FkbM family methyltransferase